MSALSHLLLHFTPGTAWREQRVPVYVRGEGCYLWDDAGNQVFDGLAGMFVVHAGHGRHEIVDAIAAQLHTLAYVPSWSSTHPAAIEAASFIARLAPGDLDVVFFVNSGSEAVEAAIKFSRQYHRARGEPSRHKVISRNLAYHGTTLGALSASGLDSLRNPFLPLAPGFRRVPNTLDLPSSTEAVAAIEEAIIDEGPDTVAMVIAEPVQNGGGALVPPNGYWRLLRETCDRHGVLLVADEVINGFGRLGTWFGSDLVGVVPDIVTFAKGATSGYAPVGGMIIRAPLVAQLMDSPLAGTFTHGATWGAHPAAMAAVNANLAILENEALVDNVQKNGPGFRERLAKLRAANDVVGAVRGEGYFYAVELAEPGGDRGVIDREKVPRLLEALTEFIWNARLHIRADDRGEPKLLLSPPLIAGPADLDVLVDRVDQVVERTRSFLRAR